MLVKCIKNGFQVHDLMIIVLGTHLNHIKNYIVTDHIFKDRLIDHSKLAIGHQAHLPCDSLIFFPEREAIHLPNHIDEFLSIMNLDMTKQIAQKVKNGD